MRLGTWRCLLAVVLTISSCLAAPCHAQQLTVAAAADLQFAMQDIADRFQKETGKTVKVVYGSSGNFLQQIQNGAPFDIFFSANLDYAKKLDTAGLTVPGSFYEYATGKLVLWVPGSSKLDLGRGLRILTDPSVQKLAIANPEHAPYGQAAVAALRAEGIYESISPKLVLGENISQAASFVLTGAADAGLVALSLAVSPNMKEKGRYVPVPDADYPPIRQACVILKSSPNQALAQSFLRFLRTPAMANVLKSYGFEIPEASH